MKTITVDNDEINEILASDIDELMKHVEDTNSVMSNDFKDRREIIERMNVIKEQCDKITNRINEYDNIE